MLVYSMEYPKCPRMRINTSRTTILGTPCVNCTLTHQHLASYDLARTVMTVVKGCSMNYDSGMNDKLKSQVIDKYNMVDI